MRKLFWDFVPGLISAVVAGAGGYFVVRWISQQGFYAPVIPGALAGLACGFASVTNSVVRGLICSMIALGLGLFTQWKTLLRQVETDGSFLDFVSHLHTETPITLLMITIGTFLGYWWGRESTNPWRHQWSVSKGQQG